MTLPVVPLSCLASRAVLAHKLDTRDLPLHLHRQLEQYKSREGAFNIMSTDLKMERMDGRELSHEERDYAMENFLTSPQSEAFLKFDVVFSRPGKNNWSITKVGPKTTTIHIRNPVQISQKERISIKENYKIYKTNYLKDGKIIGIEKKTRVESNSGQVEVVGIISSSHEVDSAGRLTWE